MSTGSGSGQGRIIERSVVEPGIELAEGAGVSAAGVVADGRLTSFRAVAVWRPMADSAGHDLKEAGERWVGSSRRRLMQPPRTAC